jgi:hypothetical protein
MYRRCSCVNASDDEPQLGLCDAGIRTKELYLDGKMSSTVSGAGAEARMAQKTTKIDTDRATHGL